LSYHVHNGRKHIFINKYLYTLQVGVFKSTYLYYIFSWFSSHNSALKYRSLTPTLPCFRLNIKIIQYYDLWTYLVLYIVSYNKIQFCTAPRTRENVIFLCPRCGNVNKFLWPMIIKSKLYEIKYYIIMNELNFDLMIIGYCWVTVVIRCPGNRVLTCSGR